MSEKKIPVSLYLDRATHDALSALAKEQDRSVSNFVVQFLNVYLLNGEIDRKGLFEKMNPSLAMIRSAMANERARLSQDN
jgi:hypothetical protein